MRCIGHAYENVINDNNNGYLEFFRAFDSVQFFAMSHNDLHVPLLALPVQDILSQTCNAHLDASAWNCLENLRR